MKKANLNDLKWETWDSPSGRYGGKGRQVSLALGAKNNAPLHKGGHPFDLEQGLLSPGMAVCPFHSHSNQWELFLITRGTGAVRFGPKKREVSAGDAVMHPPHEAHQLINTGEEDLEYLLVADNPAVDVFHYPDSNKWGFKPKGGIFLRNDVEYYRGEDEVPPEDVINKTPDIAPGTGDLATFVNVGTIAETRIASPGGKYESYLKDISLALGGIRDTGPSGGGHPFDMQERRVPPGSTVCPFHQHGQQWELFVILAGEATVRSGEESHSVGRDDAFIQPPGTPHQIRNSGAEDLRFLVIANNPPAESIYYPDSDKWGLKPERKFFRICEVDYYDGEE